MIRFVMDVNGKRTAVLMSNYGSLNVDLDDIRIVRSVQQDTVSEYGTPNPSEFSLQVKVGSVLYGLHYDFYADMEADHKALVKKICEPIMTMVGNDVRTLQTIDDRSHIHVHTAEQTVPVLNSIQSVTTIIDSFKVNSCRYANEGEEMASLSITEGGVHYSIIDKAGVIDALMKAVQDSQSLAIENMQPC